MHVRCSSIYCDNARLEYELDITTVASANVSYETFHDLCLRYMITLKRLRNFHSKNRQWYKWIVIVQRHITEHTWPNIYRNIKHTVTNKHRYTIRCTKVMSVDS